MLHIPKKTYSRRKKTCINQQLSFLSNEKGSETKNISDQIFDINRTLPDDYWKDSFDKLKDSKTPLKTPLRSSSVVEIIPNIEDESIISTPILPMLKTKLDIAISPIVGRTKYFNPDNFYSSSGSPLRILEYSSELGSSNYLSGYSSVRNNKIVEKIISKENITHRKCARKRRPVINSSKELCTKSNQLSPNDKLDNIRPNSKRSQRRASMLHIPKKAYPLRMTPWRKQQLSFLSNSESRNLFSPGNEARSISEVENRDYQLQCASRSNTESSDSTNLEALFDMHRKESSTDHDKSVAEVKALNQTNFLLSNDKGKASKQTSECNEKDKSHSRSVEVIEKSKIIKPSRIPLRRHNTKRGNNIKNKFKSAISKGQPNEIQAILTDSLNNLSLTETSNVFLANKENFNVIQIYNDHVTDDNLLISSPDRASTVTRRSNRNKSKVTNKRSAVVNEKITKELVHNRKDSDLCNSSNKSLDNKKGNQSRKRNSPPVDKNLDDPVSFVTKRNKRKTKTMNGSTRSIEGSVAVERNNLISSPGVNVLSEICAISNLRKTDSYNNSTKKSMNLSMNIIEFGNTLAANSNTIGSIHEMECELQNLKCTDRKTKSIEKFEKIGSSASRSSTQYFISEPQPNISNNYNLEGNSISYQDRLINDHDFHHSISNEVGNNVPGHDESAKTNKVLHRSETTTAVESKTDQNVQEISNFNNSPKGAVRKRKSKLSNADFITLETIERVSNKRSPDMRIQCSPQTVRSLHETLTGNDINNFRNTTLESSIDRNEFLGALNTRTVSFQTKSFSKRSDFRNSSTQYRNRSMRSKSRNILSTNAILHETLPEDLEKENESIIGELTLGPICLQPGKWRKSLSIWRRNNSFISEKINESKILPARCDLSAKNSLMPTFCDSKSRDFSKENVNLTLSILSRNNRSSRKTILDYSTVRPTIPEDNEIGSSTSECRASALLLEPTDDETSNLSKISLLDNSFSKQNSNNTLRRSKIVNSRSNCSKKESTNSNETSNERKQKYQHQLSVPLYRQPSISRRRRTSIVEGTLPRIVGSPCDTDSLFAEFVRISPYEVSLRSQLHPRDIVLRRCDQSEPLSFSDEYSKAVLHQSRKIGEGVYGEVFMNKSVRGEIVVLKIIPIEGCIEVNGEPQKKFEEILSEIVIAMELSRLRNDKEFMTCGFVEVKKVRCVQGRYPDHLIDLWELYRENCGTENDHPEIFPDDQLYIVLELANGGQDLEAFTFQNALQSYSAFVQTALTLAVAESKFQFEHRDLHWGNILLAPTEEKELTFRINGKEIKIPTHGVKATIIDYTLSRMIFDGCCLYNDLSNDTELFSATGDYQFDIYRLMKKTLEDQWEGFEPYTNVLWLHYTIDKMISGARYRCSKSKKHRSAIQAMMQLRDELLDFKSASDYVERLN